MGWRIGRKAKARIGRTAIALILIVNHVAIALGLPLPAPPGASPNELFPCMNCPCGCRTAEHCWRNCCCYTMAQKLAWAKAHGVQPTAFVREAAEKEAKSAAVAPPPEAKACCAHCHKHMDAAPAKATSAKLVLIRALECQGLGGAGLLASLPAVLPKAASFVPLPPPLPETPSFVTPLLPEVVVLVPEPPPRTSA